MSYFPDIESAMSEVAYNTPDTCFECGQKIDGPNVRFNGYLAEGQGVSLFLHRDCAFQLAQCLIVDTWPNRGDSVPMSLDADNSSRL